MNSELRTLNLELRTLNLVQNKSVSNWRRFICFIPISPVWASEYRQAVECVARNPCLKWLIYNSSPVRTTEICRTYGALIFFINLFCRDFALRASSPAYNLPLLTELIWVCWFTKKNNFDQMSFIKVTIFKLKYFFTRFYLW